MSNLVAIVGRPNVGKSTFFNRMVGERKAIMDNVSGVTRDRHYGRSEWCGKYFTVIDTGGYVTGSDDIFEQAIREQVTLALEEADVIVFMVDFQTGLTDLDIEFANVVRRSKKPIYVVVNKIDAPDRAHYIGEFYALGLNSENFYPVSSQTGGGTGELLDAVVSHFELPGEENPDQGIPRIAIAGRPNAGKSSFINMLLGNDRNIVTDIAGTTRDSIDTHYKAFGKDFILTDTAGLRRKSRIKDDNIEFYSVMRAIRAIESSDVCIIMLDATRGIESQDVNIIGLAERNRKGMVILVNKWDAVEKDTSTAKKFEIELKERIAPIDYIPVLFISVHNKQRIFQALEKAVEVYNNKSKHISTSELNDKMLPEIIRNPPPALNGLFVKIKYITQVKSHTPSFIFFCNKPKYIQTSYVRFLENKLRSYFDFEGVPINLFFREK